MGGVVDLDPSSTAAQDAIALADAMLASDGEDQVAIRNGQRYVARLRRSIAPPRTALRFSRDKLYLLIGGLGGLGLGLARWMVRHGARRLLLVVRTGIATPQQTAAISEIERFGAEVIVRSADISDSSQAANLFASLPGELAGIIHLAAAGKMSPLGEITPEDIRQVMAPKIQGSWNLHRQAQRMPLDFFIMFSSWASILGAQHLGHYIAANQFIDAVAALPEIAGSTGARRQLGGLGRDPKCQRRLTTRLPARRLTAHVFRRCV